VLHPRLTRYQVLLLATLAAELLVFNFTHGAARFWWFVTLCTLARHRGRLGCLVSAMADVWRKPLRRASKRKVVALTFDDGPDAENTPALLALLAARKVRATFFCIGKTRRAAAGTGGAHGDGRPRN